VSSPKKIIYLVNVLSSNKDFANLYVPFSETPIQFGKSSNLNNLAFPHPHERKYKFIFTYIITQVHLSLDIPSTPHKIKVFLKANKRSQHSPEFLFYTT
jgi:hypothetical protein